MHIGYFNIERNNYKKSINWNWINNQKVKKKLDYVKLINITSPLDVIIDGYTGIGEISYQTTDKPEQMDEELSSGI